MIPEKCNAHCFLWRKKKGWSSYSLADLAHAKEETPKKIACTIFQKGL